MGSSASAAQLLLFQPPADDSARGEDGGANMPQRNKRQPHRPRRAIQVELFAQPTVQRRQPRARAVTESDSVRVMILGLRRRGYRVTRGGRANVQVDGRSFDIGSLAAIFSELLEARRGRRGPRVAELERLRHEEARA